MLAAKNVLCFVHSTSAYSTRVMSFSARLADTITERKAITRHERVSLPRFLAQIMPLVVHARTHRIMLAATTPRRSAGAWRGMPSGNSCDPPGTKIRRERFAHAHWPPAQPA